MINRTFELHFTCKECDWEWSEEFSVDTVTDHCPECFQNTESDRFKEIPLTNIDFIVDYMTWGSPMNQLFLIDALTKQAQMVIDQQDQIRIDMKNNFIHPDAWIAAATEFKQLSGEFYSRYEPFKTQSNG